MIVLSLFDGMSCLQLALNKVGITPIKYYASEIDKYAMQVTMANYPNTIQIGDVRNVNGRELGFVNILAGGSPCQSFSFAGKQKGMITKCEIEILSLDHYLELKKHNFEFEGQSYLFWEYVRVLKELRESNPNIYFLLENVLMSERWERIISKALGVNPIKIDSALVSAQNRKRLYWTNIGMQPMGLFGDLESIIDQPEDKGILLKDILETEVYAKYYLSDKMLAYLKRREIERPEFGNAFKVDKVKASTLRTELGKMGSSDNYVSDNNRKAKCFTAGGNSGGLHSQMDLIIHNTMPRRSTTGKGGTGQLSRTDGGKNKGGEHTEKAPTMSSNSYEHNNMVSNIRRLTPTECERLQTVPDGYTNHVSDTQRYKMLGNGWTIDVIAHIFSYIKQN